MRLASTRSWNAFVTFFTATLVSPSLKDATTPYAPDPSFFTSSRRSGTTKVCLSTAMVLYPGDAVVAAVDRVEGPSFPDGASFELIFFGTAAPSRVLEGRRNARATCVWRGSCGPPPVRERSAANGQGARTPAALE